MNPLSLSVSLLDVALRLGAALLVGALLGLNRELRDKPAGLKTHSLVSLGAAILTLVSISFAASSMMMDGSAIARVVQGVITGIGFLGGGVILRDESKRTVRGLTTAATIWIAACLGIACGAGQWGITVIATTAVLLVLLVGEPLEQHVIRKDMTDEER
ncbi:MAG TPA: MgtC/SapB family protein [Gemmatimonadaceae bacterium]|nr:MgtC/SapB family protein [Gemmatimonadaceae bacterium]